MKSPFPGMDPYLEAHWLDVHPRLIVEASTVIQDQLGDDLVARIEERLLEAVIFHIPSDPVKQRFIEIVDLARAHGRCARSSGDGRSSL
jgi:Protein of unknown function (DUF4058)